MRKLKKTLPILIAVPLISGCGSKMASDNSNPPRTAIVNETNTQSNLPDTPEELYYALADSVRENLDESFLPSFTSYLENNQWGITLENVQQQIVANPKALPLLPGFTFPLIHRSIYDGANCPFKLLALSQNPSLTIVYLGDCDPAQLELQRDDCCLIAIPSRPKLNYRLVAEGDFWNCLKELNELIPTLNTQKLFLASSTDTADAALYFLDRYPGKFNGAAIGGAPSDVEYNNLTNASIVRYGPANTHGLIFDLLESKGNRMVSERFPSLNEAIARLENSPPDLINAQFFDYKYSSPAPWLKIITKRSEIEPAQVTLEQKGRTMVIRSNNVASALLVPPFPNGIEVVEFEGSRIPVGNLQENLMIGESVDRNQWTLKSETPPGLLNFFRNEPVFVVYYDGMGVPGYLAKVKSTAEAIATLQFKGLPKTDVKLPLIPLSDYHPAREGRHRLIYVGGEEAAKKLLEKESGYWPVETGEKNLLVKGVEVSYNKASDPTKQKRLAYTLFYPCEKEKNIVLSLCLIAEDEKAIDLLKDQFTSSTAFFKNEDLVVWNCDSGLEGSTDYNLAWEGIFDSYWSYSDIPSFSIPVPEESSRVWQALLHDMMVEESQTDNSILSPLVNAYSPPPGELTYSTMEKFIPNRSFAIVTLRGSATSTIGDKLMGATMNMQIRGFGAFISRKEGEVARFDPTSLQKGKIRFLVETSALRTLSNEELALIEYEFLPDSLHDLVLKRAKRRGQQFGKDLIRLSNEINSLQGKKG